MIKKEMQFPPKANYSFDEAYFSVDEMKHKSAVDTLKLINFIKPKKSRERLSKKKLKDELLCMQALVNTLSKQKEQIMFALELACEKIPMSKEYCPSPPIYHDLQKEYGLDEPYIDIEDQCLDSNNCLDCVKSYFLNEAEEKLKEKNYEIQSR